MPKGTPQSGPHSKLFARGVVDPNSRDGRFLAAVRAELTAHLGGGPLGDKPLSTPQRILIDRVAKEVAGEIVHGVLGPQAANTHVKAHRHSVV